MQSTRTVKYSAKHTRTHTKDAPLFVALNFSTARALPRFLELEEMRTHTSITSRLNLVVLALAQHLAFLAPVLRLSMHAYRDISASLTAVSPLAVFAKFLLLTRLRRDGLGGRQGVGLRHFV